MFDEADAVFGHRGPIGNSTDRYANVDVGLLLYHMERFPGIVLLTTNRVGDIDEAFFRRMKGILEFPLPNSEAREGIWRILLPARAPLAPDVDFAALAGKFELSGGNIKNAIFEAATRAALRDESARAITMPDLMAAAEEERSSQKDRKVGFLN